MDKLLLLLAIPACLCATGHGFGWGYNRHGHHPRPKPRPPYCKGHDIPGDCKISQPEGPDELSLCPLTDTTCGDNMTMTCTDSPYFLHGLTLTDMDGIPMGACVNDTMDFEEGLYCCKPDCPCLSGGKCSMEVVGNFTTNTTGVCVPDPCNPQECSNHTDCTDSNSLCVQGNDTSYCLVPQSRPHGYTCPGVDETEAEPEPETEGEPEPEPEGEPDEHRGSVWPKIRNWWSGGSHDAPATPQPPPVGGSRPWQRPRPRPRSRWG